MCQRFVGKISLQTGIRLLSKCLIGRGCRLCLIGCVLHVYDEFVDSSWSFIRFAVDRGIGVNGLMFLQVVEECWLNIL